MILEKKSEGIKKFIKKVEKKVGVLVEVKTIFIIFVWNVICSEKRTDFQTKTILIIGLN